jgi:hypothetical protein
VGHVASRAVCIGDNSDMEIMNSGGGSWAEHVEYHPRQGTSQALCAGQCVWT